MASNQVEYSEDLEAGGWVGSLLDILVVELQMEQTFAVGAVAVQVE